MRFAILALMNYRGAILWGLGLTLFLYSCSKDPANYRAYNAANHHSATDTTKTGGTHGTDGTTDTGTGGSTGITDTAGTADSPGDRPDDPDHPDEPKDYYFAGTLNGKKLSWNVTDNLSGWVIGSSSTVANNNTGYLQGGLGFLLSASEIFKPQLSIEFDYVNLRVDADKIAYLKNFITTGDWLLATKDVDFQPGKKVIVIHYADASGMECSSLGAQTGGNAKVSSVTYIPPQPGIKDAFKIKLTFNCVLYPVNSIGAPLTLADGKAVIKLGNSL